MMRANKPILLNPGLTLALVLLSPIFVNAAELATAKVKASNSANTYVAEGVVEAVQQSLISAQVAGRITQLTVRAGDRSVPCIRRWKT